MKELAPLRSLGVTASTILQNIHMEQKGLGRWNPTENGFWRGKNDASAVIPYAPKIRHSCFETKIAHFGGGQSDLKWNWIGVKCLLILRNEVLIWPSECWMKMKHTHCMSSHLWHNTGPHGYQTCHKWTKAIKNQHKQLQRSVMQYSACGDVY